MSRLNLSVVSSNAMSDTTQAEMVQTCKYLQEHQGMRMHVAVMVRESLATSRPQRPSTSFALSSQYPPSPKIFYRIHARTQHLRIGAEVARGGFKI